MNPRSAHVLCYDSPQIMRQAINPSYIWSKQEWPAFRYDAAAILAGLGVARGRQGKLRGALERVGFGERVDAHARTIEEEAIETSEIEGERLSGAAVRSSVARRLGLPGGGLGSEDARADGIVAVTLDATRRYGERLTVARIHGWHRELFPHERGQTRTVAIGRWRDDARGPMQVVSGPLHRPTVHFEGPPADRVPLEIERFLAWFGTSEGNVDGLIRAAQAHLWVVTIHPYDDGNGRIARAVADMALAQDEASRDRFVSMSRQIRIEKAPYYDILERTQRGDADITPWVRWFLECYARAAEHALVVLDDVSRASRFWATYRDVAFSSRQKKILERFLHDFDGKLTAKKWAAIARTSLDTAQRDVADLAKAGVLRKNAGGSKNTSYELILW